EFVLRSTTHGLSDDLDRIGASALDLVERHFLAATELGKLLPWLQHHHSERSEELLDRARERNPDRLVRGRAGYALATALTERAKAARLLGHAPEVLRNIEHALPAELSPRPA